MTEKSPERTILPAPDAPSRCWRRWALTVAIVGFWLVMMAMLVGRDIWPRRYAGGEAIIEPMDLARDWQDVDEAMEIRFKDTSLGVVRTQVLRAERAGFLANCRLRVRAPLGGLSLSLGATARASLDPQMTLEDASVDVRVAGTRLRVEASVFEEALVYRMRQNGREQVGRVPLLSPPSFLQAVQPLLARRYELRVGASYAVPVFDPLWDFGEGLATMRVVRRETIRLPDETEPIEAFLVETRFQDIVIKAWVDEEGRALRQEFGKDLVMVRLSPEAAEERFPDLAEPVVAPDVDRAALHEAGMQVDAAQPSLGEGTLDLLRGMLKGQ